MWNQACSQFPDGMTSQKAMTSKRTSLHILPCTVSQLLSASEVSNDTFGICDLELNQVSVVGVVRGFAPSVTSVQYSVDDMTGPALTVKQWVNTEASSINRLCSEDCALRTFASPGTYVKVIGSLRNFIGQRSLLAMTIRCIKDTNEITSHMLEVVRAHMQLFGKAFDVNMNTTAVSLSGRVVEHRGGGLSQGILPKGLTTIQGQVCGFKVLHAIKRFSVCDYGISFHDLRTQLDYLSMRDIRYLTTSLYLLCACMSFWVNSPLVCNKTFKKTDGWLSMKFGMDIYGLWMMELNVLDLMAFPLETPLGQHFHMLTLALNLTICNLDTYDSNTTHNQRIFTQTTEEEPEAQEEEEPFHLPFSDEEQVINP
ncbi:hypothetical protein L3Q82_014749, partial [Scortum barcoo]